MVEPDRKKAIVLALTISKPEDVILIAGKGHEDYQIINGKKLHFNDVEIIQNYFDGNKDRIKISEENIISKNDPPINLVVGLGKTGISCIEYLVGKGRKVIVADTRNSPPEYSRIKNVFPNLEVYTGDISKDIIKKADNIILSPGVSLNEPEIKFAVKLGKEIIGDIELFAREAKAPIIGITGTNGKSTVTTLIGEMAKESGFKVLVGGKHWNTCSRFIKTSNSRLLHP